MGDFNTGPAFPELGIDEEIEENYQVIVDAGFFNVNVEQETPFCTWCADENILITDGKI